jgi:hypothetical protein
MRISIIFLIITVALFLQSCLPSLHPLYTEKDVIASSKLEETWFMDEEYWRFEKADSKAKPSYDLYIGQHLDSLYHLFTVHLLELDGKLFLDFYPLDLDTRGIDDFYSIHFVPAHTFAIVDEMEEKLVIRLADGDRLDKIFTEGKIRIKHEVLQHNQIVLTAPTKELQKFVLKYSDHDGLFPEESTFDRVAD